GRVLERRTGGGAGDLGAGFDLAVAHRVAGPLWLGVAGQALGAGALSGEAAPLRTGLRVSAATRSVPLGPLDVAGAATAGLREGGEVEGGAGLEVAWWPLVGRTFFVRAGARVPEGGDLSPTLGAAFRGDAIGVEYAWDEATGAHRVGLGWR
ncbi:MAG TPA: hypothetical protein VMK65_06100, partial [Longimicrobiales bacterium]|nr:hypothetical protein [Longimicrobiales bacterium]